MRIEPMPADSHTRLILVRHGQTQWNLQGRYQGRADTPICPVGLATAQRVAALLRGCGATVLLASPLERARASAEIIGRILGDLQTVVDERLIEIDFGQWQGLTQAQIKTRWPILLRAWKRAPDSVRFPGGERLADALERLRHFLRRPPWAAGAAPRCVIAVTHAGPIRLARLLADGLSPVHYRTVQLHVGAAYEFDLDPPGRLRSVGHRMLT